MKEGEDPNNPVRVYADGVFDFFHYGHARQLEQCKKLFKHVYLIVGVSGQVETEQKKGVTIMNEEERVQSIHHCRWVDEVICPCPWVITDDFLTKHNIDYVAHDNLPYIGADGKDIYQHLRDIGKFKETQRTEGVSTSDLIGRILKDRDDYSLRNLKRGVKRKEIGLSWFGICRLKSKQIFKTIRRRMCCQKRKQKIN